jgi:predicted peptidase
MLPTIITVLGTAVGCSRPMETGFLSRTVVDDDGVHRYQVFVPFGYEREVSLPLILFLHGADQRGTDGFRQTEVGLGSALRRTPDRYPAIVVFPQGPPDAYRFPERFAALLAICSFIDLGHAVPAPVVPPEDGEPFSAVAGKLRRLPAWVFHGGADPVVPVDQSRRLVAALRSAGAPVEYTELPRGAHNVWDIAYGSEEVARWLFSQRRSDP